MQITRLKELFAEHLKEHNYAASTILDYAENISIFIRYLETFHKEADTKRISKKTIISYMQYLKAYRNKRTKKKLAERSILHYLSSLKNFLAYLADTGYLYKDFSSLFDIRRKKGALPRKTLSEREISALFASINERTYLGFRNRTIFELAYNTGMRQGELVHLTVYDINFEGKTVFIRRGKMRKDRIVPVGEYCISYLREYLNEVRPALLEDNMGENRLFISNSTCALKKGGFNALVCKYKKISGVDFSFHILRHTFATHMLKSGAHVIYIQRMLGHEQVSTTQIYTRVYPVDLKRVIAEKHPRNRKEIKDEKIVLPGKKKKVYKIGYAKRMFAKEKKK